MSLLLFHAYRHYSCLYVTLCLDGASLQALIDVSVPQTSDCDCHQKLNDANDITDYCYMCIFTVRVCVCEEGRQ